jgi:hypothetical protein
MNLQEIANIAEVISSIGVVVSLIYVGVQVRQNTRAQKAATYHGLTSNTVAILSPMLAEPGITEFIVRMQANPEAATPAEKLRFHAFLLIGFRHWDNLYFQYRTGALDEQMWLSYDRTMSKWMDNEAWRAWFRANASSFSPDLRELLMDRLQP